MTTSTPFSCSCAVSRRAQPLPQSRLWWSGALALALEAGVRASSFEAADILSVPWNGFVFRPQFNIQGIFTDNLYYGNNSVTGANVFRPITLNTNNNSLQLGPPTTNQVVLRSQVSDVISYVSPGLNVDYGTPTGNKIGASYQFDQITYLDHPINDTHQQRMSLTTQIDRGAMSIRGIDQIAFLSNLLGGGTGSGLLGLVVNRRTWDDSYNFRLDLSDKTSVFVKGAHSAIDYQAGTPIFDTDTMSGTLGMAYNPAAKLAMTVESYYGQSALGSNLAALPKGPHSQFYGAFVGARGEFTPKIEGSAKVGVESRDFPGLVGGNAIVSPTFDVSVSYAATLKTLASFSFSRRTELSGYYGGQSLITTGLSANVQQGIGKTGMWFLIGRMGVALNDFSSVQLPVPVLATDRGGNVLFNNFGQALYSSVNGDYARSETAITLGIQVNYQPRPWLTASLAYDLATYTPHFNDPKVAATHPSIDYVDNRATFRIAIGF